MICCILMLKMIHHCVWPNQSGSLWFIWPIQWKNATNQALACCFHECGTFLVFLWQSWACLKEKVQLLMLYSISWISVVCEDSALALQIWSLSVFLSWFYYFISDALSGFHFGPCVLGFFVGLDEPLFKFSFPFLSVNFGCTPVHRLPTISRVWGRSWCTQPFPCFLFHFWMWTWWWSWNFLLHGAWLQGWLVSCNICRLREWGKHCILLFFFRFWTYKKLNFL